MAIAKITTWLKDLHRDYTLGVLLYDHYGKSVLLKAFFKNGDSGYHQERLYNVLEELNQELEEQTNVSTFQIPTVEQLPVPAKHYGVTETVWETLPEQIKDLYTINSKLHRHSQMNFDQMKLAGTDQQRLNFALEILSERRKLNQNWADIKDFHKQGKLREEIKEKEAISVDEMSIADLIKKFNNLPSYISKDKGRIKELPDGPAKNKVLLRLQENEIAFQLIKTRLGGMQ